MDTLGYYAILGLDVRRVAQYGPEDIKAAYRAKAMEMHPDKVGFEALSHGKGTDHNAEESGVLIRCGRRLRPYLRKT